MDYFRVRRKTRKKIFHHSDDDQSRPKDESFPLYEVSINEDPSVRIDKYREGGSGTCSLHPATLHDYGEKIKAVAKITLAKQPELKRLT